MLIAFCLFIYSKGGKVCFGLLSFGCLCALWQPQAAAAVFDFFGVTDRPSWSGIFFKRLNFENSKRHWRRQWRWWQEVRAREERQTANATANSKSICPCVAWTETFDSSKVRLVVSEPCGVQQSATSCQQQQHVVLAAKRRRVVAHGPLSLVILTFPLVCWAAFWVF